MNKFEEVLSCTSCSATDMKEVVSVFEGEELFTRIVVCLNCGLVFRNFRFSLEEIDRFYKEYSFEVDNNPTLLTSDEHEKRRYKRYKRNMEWIESHKPMKKNSRVLDIACGPGTGLLPFKEAGYSVYGTELCQSRCQYAFDKWDITVKHGPFEFFDFTDQKFDVIICSQFLEHAHQPLEILLKMRDLLSDDGIIYVEVPNHVNYASFGDALYVYHNNSFTHHSLKNVLGIAGFTIVDEYEPQTRFRPGAVKHIGIVAVPKRGNSFQVDSPDELYHSSIIDAYFKQIDCPKPREPKNLQIKYRSIDKDIIDAHIAKKITPNSLHEINDGCISAVMYGPISFKLKMWRLMRKKIGLKSVVKKAFKTLKN